VEDEDSVDVVGEDEADVISIPEHEAMVEGTGIQVQGITNKEIENEGVMGTEILAIDADEQ